MGEKRVSSNALHGCQGHACSCGRRLGLPGESVAFKAAFEFLRCERADASTETLLSSARRVRVPGNEEWVFLASSCPPR